MWRPKLLRPRVAGLVTFVARMLTAAVLATAAPETPIDSVIQLDQLQSRQTLTLRGEVFHVQGLDLDRDFIYVSSVDGKAHRGYLHKFTRGGDPVQTIELTDGPRYHPGGIAIDGNSIWIPVAEYRAASSTRMVEIDKTTLRILSTFIVPDHIGAVAARGGRLYGANWDAERLYIWTRTGQEIASFANPTRVAYQDFKFVGSALVASGISRDQLTGAIDWLDPETLRPVARWPVGRKTSGALWTREGMAMADGELYLMPDDGHDGTATVGVFDLGEVKTAAETVTAPGTASGARPVDIAGR